MMLLLQFVTLFLEITELYSEVVDQVV